MQMENSVGLFYDKLHRADFFSNATLHLLLCFRFSKFRVISLRLFAFVCSEFLKKKKSVDKNIFFRESRRVSRVSFVQSHCRYQQVVLPLVFARTAPVVAAPFPVVSYRHRRRRQRRDILNDFLPKFSLSRIDRVFKNRRKSPTFFRQNFSGKNYLLVTDRLWPKGGSAEIQKKPLVS